ncbi:Carboxylesterase [Deinococcus proteolyticus MRP]|uniref:Carboxylic ester hydrolase n=1 Tax=Deinococcus proteolyticus (strain ATCC 35074 / DSM 20540 / JCM 6276 / NBRC 101906 / NCIMB 13154 / VKM Ac-1939 / CCM 2703 / MRP) TaxID=693977 RepID=F0RKB3_DEIPM|nr:MULTISPECIES: carboxylesterase/lipase family protein [Deinococcus]ADY26692.1 Carboxylesterase [Deinococcus proteolyticus MRP]MCY1702820.1 carboxylesterase/lipase family protein [Deinococcus sp. SL84]
MSRPLLIPAPLTALAVSALLSLGTAAAQTSTAQTSTAQTSTALAATAQTTGTPADMAPPPAPDPAARVQAPAGTVTGFVQSGVKRWLGLPYAQPPVGERRWKAPQPLPRWDGERSATVAGAACPQFISIPGVGQQSRGAEDCLTLNVYAPDGAVQTAQPLPVMVWIHGGSYQTGAGYDYDPSVLAREQNVVVVSVNYRLGALGFLAAEALNDGGRVGNFGLLDQQLALNWVRGNIAAFGGDARNVTVFGESAGGMSICQQLAAPGARGLFDKAIIQSGPCTAPGITVPRAEAVARSSRMIEALGCAVNDADCLRALPAEQLARARPEGLGAGFVPFPPLHGDATLPRDPAEVFAAGNQQRVPVLIGSNLDEGTLFTAWAGDPHRDLSLGEYVGLNVVMNRGRALRVLGAYPVSAYGTRALAGAASVTDSVFACPTSDLARNLSAAAPVYAYEFRDRSAPSRLTPTAGIPRYGAFHAAELPSIFGTPVSLGDPAQFTPQQAQLARTMRTYWANFARTGNPGGSGLPQWPVMQPGGAPVVTFQPQGVGITNDFRKLHQCGTVWR